MEPDEISWGICYRICFHSIEDNSLKWLQYRILHRILGVRDLLFRIKVSDINMCRLCKEHSETIVHLFSECTKSHSLWQNVISWIKSSINLNINLTKNMKILGYTEQGPNFWPLNFILTITRQYIFTKAKDLGQLNIYHLQKLIHKRYTEQETLSTLNGKTNPFQEKWVVWKKIFDFV